MPERPLKRVRDRRRGVALVEALIAISMIVVLFGGVVFVHNVYVAKTRALRVARTQAWFATEMNCEGDGHGSGSETAAVPSPYSRTRGGPMTLGARHEMVCTERHSEHKDLWAVFEWAGVAKQMGSFTHQIVNALKF